MAPSEVSPEELRKLTDKATKEMVKRVDLLSKSNSDDVLGMVRQAGRARREKLLADGIRTIDERLLKVAEEGRLTAEFVIDDYWTGLEPYYIQPQVRRQNITNMRSLEWIEISCGPDDEEKVELFAQLNEHYKSRGFEVKLLSVSLMYDQHESHQYRIAISW